MLKKLWNKLKRFFHRAAERRGKIVTKRRVVQAVYFSVTTLFSAVSLAFFLDLWLVGLIMTVILTHEFSHYWTASRAGRVAALPFFIPIPFFGIIGATHVKGHEPVSDMKIAMAGPTGASILTIGMLIAFAVNGFMPGFWASFWMLAFQIYTGTLGGDGRRYRKARNEIRVATAASSAAFAG